MMVSCNIFNTWSKHPDFVYVIVRCVCYKYTYTANIKLEFISQCYSFLCATFIKIEEKNVHWNWHSPRTFIEIHGNKWMTSIFSHLRQQFLLRSRLMALWLELRFLHTIYAYVSTTYTVRKSGSMFWKGEHVFGSFFSSSYINQHHFSM